MTVPVTAPSTHDFMHFRRTPTRANRRRQIAAAVQLLRPCLGSARLVNLFRNIAMLAVTRPEHLATIEILVKGLSDRQPAKAPARDGAHKANEHWRDRCVS